MSDTWGALGDRTRAHGVAHGHADPAAVGADLSAAVPDGSPPAAESFTVKTDPALMDRYRLYATWCGYLVITIGCVVLIGWFAGIRVLASLSPSWIAMKSNTALGLLAAGSSLCLNNAHLGEQGWARQVSRLCAVFVIVLASGTLIEHLSGFDLGIDQFLVTEPPGAIGTLHPGRMAPQSMLSFEIFGISLLTMSSARSGWQILTSVLAVLAVALSMMVLIGYLFDARDISRAPGQFSGLAANASIAFLALGVGILFTNLPTGLLHSLASPYLRGMMLRRMLPAVVHRDCLATPDCPIHRLARRECGQRHRGHYTRRGGNCYLECGGTRPAGQSATARRRADQTAECHA